MQIKSKVYQELLEYDYWFLFILSSDIELSRLVAFVAASWLRKRKSRSTLQHTAL